MKKPLALIISFVIITGAAYAGDNQSAKYIRLLSRNTASDSIDSAFFNPAGTAFLEQGIHVQLNGQTVILKYSHELQGKTYSMSNWVPVVPSAYVGYNGGDWALFAGHSIPQGGGRLKWDSVKFFYQGQPWDVGFEGKSSTHMLSIGGSYAFSPNIAVGARFDFSIARAKYEANLFVPVAKGGGAAKLKKSGTGFGGALGVHVRPNEEINASLTIESAQKVKLKSKSLSGAVRTAPLLENNTAKEADTPWAIRAGFSYTFPFDLEIPISLKYSFWKALDANMNRNELVAAVGFRYWLKEELDISLGVSFANADKRKDKLDSTFLDPELASFTVGGGMGWEIFDNFNLDIGLLYPIYFQADGRVYKNLSKQVVDIGVGVGYIF